MAQTDRQNGRASGHALIVVDVQADFLPGGALAVEEGDAVIAPIAAAMQSAEYDLIVATQDWHPHGHISFASSHAGRRPYDAITLYGYAQTLWPDHCVAGTPGAELHPGLPWERAQAIVRKGCAPAVDSYSAFRNNRDALGDRPPTGLAGYLKERGISSVSICGLTRDYCVRFSSEDAAAAGFTVTVLWGLTRAVNPDQDAEVRKTLGDRGVAIVGT